MRHITGKVGLLIFFGAVVALLIATNPGIGDYEQYIKNHILEQTGKEGRPPLEQFAGKLFGGFAANLVTNQTVRRDFVLFSLYTTEMGGERLAAVGVLKNFVIYESPKWKKGERGKK